MKPIEEVEAGDLVQARDDGTGVTSLKPVLQLIGNPGKHVIALTFVDTLGVEERMEVTEDHPFMTMTGWQLAAEMPLGAALKTYDGRALSLKSRVDEGKQARTYNFEVAESHTYFVGHSGVWVHNSGPCDISGAAKGVEGIGFARSQLQHGFKHAKDFGVSGNANNKTLSEFRSALQSHVDAAGTRAIQGTYRGNPVTHHLDPITGLNVIRDSSGNFLSGWKLSPQQLKHVLTTGKLGGG